MATEFRASPRKVIRCQATIAMEGGGAIKATTVDISVGGMCLLVPRSVPQGGRCIVVFDMYVNGKLLNVKAIAKIAYCVCSVEGFKTGLQFTQLDAATAKMIDDLVRGVR